MTSATTGLPLINIWPLHARRKHGPPYAEQTQTPLFENPLDALREYDASGGRSYIQSEINNALRSASEIKLWRTTKTPPKKRPYFAKYKKHAFGSFNLGVVETKRGLRTKFADWAQKLNAEIDASATIAPAAQLVFHGRSGLITLNTPLESFLSTSLCPIVAANSSNRGSTKFGGRRVVCVIELADDFKCIWGEFGQSPEWEILFPPGAIFEGGALEHLGSFDVQFLRLVGFEDSVKADHSKC